MRERTPTVPLNWCGVRPTPPCAVWGAVAPDSSVAASPPTKSRRYSRSLSAYSGCASARLEVRLQVFELVAAIVVAISPDLRRVHGEPRRDHPGEPFDIDQFLIGDRCHLFHEADERWCEHISRDDRQIGRCPARARLFDDLPDAYHPWPHLLATDEAVLQGVLWTIGADRRQDRCIEFRERCHQLLGTRRRPREEVVAEQVEEGFVPQQVPGVQDRRRIARMALLSDVH
jgi:hypothetical protein